MLALFHGGNSRLDAFPIEYAKEDEEADALKNDVVPLEPKRVHGVLDRLKRAFGRASHGAMSFGYCEEK